jgi:hypothetical protein
MGWQAFDPMLLLSCERYCCPYCSWLSRGVERAVELGMLLVLGLLPAGRVAGLAEGRQRQGPRQARR